MALVGVAVILSWSVGLIRSAGTVLLDMVPDRHLAGRIRKRLEVDGDRVSDLHLWRLGPGHAGLIAAVVSDRPQAPTAYKHRLDGIAGLSHIDHRGARLRGPRAQGGVRFIARPNGPLLYAAIFLEVLHVRRRRYRPPHRASGAHRRAPRTRSRICRASSTPCWPASSSCRRSNVAGVEPMTSVTPMAMKKRADEVTDGGMAEESSTTRRRARIISSSCRKWSNKCASPVSSSFWSMIDALPPEDRERILREQAARFACDAPAGEPPPAPQPTRTSASRE